VLATFASILALLNVLSSLRYELAIAVPEDDDEAVALVWLCFGLVAISTGLTALGVLLLGDQLVIWLNEPALKPLLWLLPVGVLLSGVYKPLSYWAIRRKQFGLLAQTKFRQSIFGVATNLAAAPLGTIGLLLGQIVSQSAGLGAFFSSFKNQLDFRGIDYRRPLRHVFIKNIKFFLFNVPAGFISAFHNQFPILLLSSVFGASQLGQFSIAQRMIILPATLISSSVAQVFLGNAPDKYREGVVHVFIARSAKQLLKLGLVTAVPIGLLLPLTAKFVFGPRWSELSAIIPLLMPIYLATVVASPFGMALVAARKNKISLYTQMLIFSVKIVPLFMAVSLFNLSFYSSLAVFAASSAFSSVLYLKIVYEACKR